MEQVNVQGQPAQPSLLASMWQHRWVVLLAVLAALALGFVINDAKTVDYVATADLIVEDPRASSLQVTDVARQSTQDSERYLADQVEILRSSEAALLASNLTGGEISSKQLLEFRSVTGDSTSNLIEISFRAATPARAKQGADALLNAYEALLQSRVEATAEAALAKLDALTAAVDDEIASLGTRIEQLTTADPERLELETQVAAAVQQLNSLRTVRASLPLGSEARLAINEQIDELLRDFETWRAVLAIELEDGELATLQAERAAAITERAALTARRNAIAVDAELAVGGVTLASPAALPEDPAGIGDALVLAASLVLGLAVAAVLSNYLALRYQAVSTRESPEQVLGAPLLAEVPDFAHEGISSEVPVTAAPTSAAAEAFRFAAAAIDIRASATDARMVSIVSATVGGGKTAMVANAGMAAAREGKRILLVDGDFGSQELTRLLTDETPKWGLTDVVQGDVHLLKALVEVSLGDGRSVSLLSRGSRDVEAASFYQSVLTREFFAHLPMLYDLVLVDCPPLLQVAYASTLVAYTEATVVLVVHRSSTRQLEDLADRMELIGTPVLGYAYTKAPLRMEMTTGVGSTADRLGTTEEPARSSWWARLRSERA